MLTKTGPNCSARGERTGATGRFTRTASLVTARTRELDCAPSGWPARRAGEEASTSVKARVYVTLKPGVLDPQGKAIQKALNGLGFEGVEHVRQGKVIDLEVTETDPAKARAAAEAMCEQLLANTVIENYAIELDRDGEGR